MTRYRPVWATERDSDGMPARLVLAGWAERPPAKPRRKRVYPPGWKELSLYIRYGRANAQCECEGECGLHRTHPGPRRCEERDGQPAKWAKGRVVLTVAHLCRDSSCGEALHLKAMCNRCHLRYDVKQHVKSSHDTRRAGRALGELF